MAAESLQKEAGFYLLKQRIVERGFLFITLFLLAACHKNKDDLQGSGNNSSKRLVKITKTKGTQTTIFNFTYDASGRLSSMISNNGEADMLFSYDTNGNLVTVEESEPQFTNKWTYTYSNGQLVSATFKDWLKSNGSLNEDDSYTYSVSNGRVTRFTLTMSQSMTVEFTVTYNNDGNVTKVEAPGFLTATFSYGNKKPVYPIVYKYVTDWGFSPMFFARNDLTVQSWDFAGTLNDRTVTMQYTYDADGYALTSTDGTTQYTYQYQ